MTSVPDKIGPRCPPGGDCPAKFEPHALRCPVCDMPLHHDYRGHVITGRYEVIELIGAGGMGLVYKARHIAMDRFVAIKVLPESSANLIARFQREARSMSQLSHPNVVQVYDFGSMANRDLFLVMEYLEGYPLSRVPMPEVEAKWLLEIIQQVCAALGVAHEKGIVHRDLKPDNIFITPKAGAKDVVKVLDFGIAKLMEDSNESMDLTLTQVGRLCGTPHFMAPEQITDGVVDGRTDIYALGVLIFQTLAKRRLFDADSMQHVLSKHVYEAPESIRKAVPGASYSREFEALILKCLEKKADDRYRSVEILHREIDKFLSGEFSIRDNDYLSHTEDLTIDVDPKDIEAQFKRKFTPTPGSSNGDMMVVMPTNSAVIHQKGKVLLVDDSLYLSNQLTEMLYADGFEVVLGRNGLEGLEQLELNSNIFMVVTDMNMPVMDGMAFLEKIRQHPRMRDLPVMVLSAANEQKLFQRASDLGAFAWVVKPADPKAIVKAINQVAKERLGSSNPS